VLRQQDLAVFGRADSAEWKADLDRFHEAQEKAEGYVVSNAFSKLLEENGAQNLNASTGEDNTNYFYSLPSNKVSLWALLEGDRMTYPVFREFYKERDVVIEERRLRNESTPRGRLRDETSHAAFVAHPYRNGVIGWRSDLESFRRADAEDFFREHYNAANLVVVVVGDVKLDQVHELAEKYFSAIPSGPKNEPVLTVEPPPHGEKIVRLREEAQPLLYVAYYGGPAFTDPAYLPVDALTEVLARGRSSRLYTTLVKERKLATNVSCYAGMPGLKYPNVVWFSLSPAPGVSPDTLLSALQGELDSIRDHPVTARDLENYRSRARSDFVRGLHTNFGLAFQLAFYQTRLGDWRELFRYLKRIESITPEQVNAEAERIFTWDHRTAGMIESASGEAQEGGE
jgi:predicted Zn-dependent peptidase